MDSLIVILPLLADLIIWGGVFFLRVKSHIRRAEKSGEPADIKGLVIGFVVSFIIVHAFFIWIGIELVKWGGMD